MRNDMVNNSCGRQLACFSAFGTERILFEEQRPGRAPFSVITAFSSVAAHAVTAVFDMIFAVNAAVAEIGTAGKPAGSFRFSGHRLTSQYKQTAMVIHRIAGTQILHRPVKRHNERNSTVHLLGGFFFIQLEVAGRISSDICVVHVPAQNRMTTVCQLVFQHNAHQFFRRGRHILEALSEGNHRESIVLQRLYHHGRIPAVVGDFTDVVAFAQLADKLLDETVMDNVAFGGLDESHPRPLVIWHMVAANSQRQCIFREPEKRKNPIRLFLGGRRENQHQRRKVGGAGKVESRITRSAFQPIRVHSPSAFVPFIHRHPANGLLDPLVESQLAEHVLISRRLQGFPVRVPDFIYGSSSNASRVAVLEEGMTFVPLSLPNNEAQFLETRKFQVAEICRIFRVPPHMIGDLDRATFSNIEHQSIDFAVHTIRPWLVRIEQAVNRALFSEKEKGRFYVQFNLDGLMRGDYKSRMEGYAIARQNGWMSANDIRELENMNAMSDEEGGNAYLVNGNMIPVNLAGITAFLAAAASAAQAENNEQEADGNTPEQEEAPPAEDSNSRKRRKTKGGSAP